MRIDFSPTDTSARPGTFGLDVVRLVKPVLPLPSMEMAPAAADAAAGAMVMSVEADFPAALP